MNRCKSCGRVIKGETNPDYCSNCLDDNNKVKDYTEVTKDLSKYLKETQGLDETAAANAAKAIASSQPHWKRKQGVYFESDMKKKRRVIVSLVVIIALILSSVGIWIWSQSTDEQVYDIFEGNKQFEITRKVGDYTVHELDINGYQRTPVQLYEDDDSIFCFLSFAESETDIDSFWTNTFKVEYSLYGYNKDESYGARIPIDFSTNNQQRTMIKSDIDICNNRILSTSNALDGKSVDEYDPFCGILFAQTVNKNLFKKESDSGWMDSTSSFDWFAQQGSDTKTMLWVPTNSNKPVSFPMWHGEYISWIEIPELFPSYDSYTGGLAIGIDKVILLNPYTNHQRVITETVYQNRLLRSDNFIAWLDTRDMSVLHPVIYGFDIEKQEEFIISYEPDMSFIELNDNYLLLSHNTEDVYSYIPRNGLFVYDLHKREMFNSSLTDSILYDFLYFDNPTSIESNVRPIVEISENNPDSNGCFVAWIEKIDGNQEVDWINVKGEESEFSPQMIAINGIDKRFEEPLRVLSIDDFSLSQSPRAISDEFIVWQSMEEETGISRLWLGKLSDGFEDGIIESILIDECDLCKHMDTTNSNDIIFHDVTIADDTIFWTKDVSFEKTNICWVELSEIFGE